MKEEPPDVADEEERDLQTPQPHQEDFRSEPSSKPASSLVNPDPDPVGSEYNWFSWIRSRMISTDLDPAALKLITF